MTGKDITVILTRNNVAVANTRIKSNQIKTHCNVIEKASSTQQEWEENIAGRKSWSMNISYLVLAYEQVADLLYVGQTFGVAVKYQETNLLVGSAIMMDASNVSTLGNLAQGSFTLKGSGALSIPQT